jgi:hypothetical protein
MRRTKTPLPSKLTPCQGGETLRLLNALVERLTVVHGSPEYLERWGLSPRFGPYKGPRYDAELVAATKHIDWIRKCHNK